MGAARAETGEKPREFTATKSLEPRLQLAAEEHIRIAVWLMPSCLVHATGPRAHHPQSHHPPCSASEMAESDPPKANPAWWEDELVDAMKFAIEVQELKLADRVRGIEAREQKLEDRVRDIETREWVVGACERLFGHAPSLWRDADAGGERVARIARRDPWPANDRFRLIS